MVSDVEALKKVQENANSMAVSGLACRKALVGTERSISVLFGNGLRNKLSYLPFLGLRPIYQLCQVGEP